MPPDCPQLHRSTAVASGERMMSRVFAPPFWLATDRIETLVVDRGSDADAFKEVIANGVGGILIPGKVFRRTPRPPKAPRLLRAFHTDSWQCDLTLCQPPSRIEKLK